MVACLEHERANPQLLGDLVDLDGVKVPTNHGRSYKLEGEEGVDVGSTPDGAAVHLVHPALIRSGTVMPEWAFVPPSYCPYGLGYFVNLRTREVEWELPGTRRKDLDEKAPAVLAKYGPKPAKAASNGRAKGKGRAAKGKGKKRGRDEGPGDLSAFGFSSDYMDEEDYEQMFEQQHVPDDDDEDYR